MPRFTIHILQQTLVASTSLYLLLCPGSYMRVAPSNMHVCDMMYLHGLFPEKAMAAVLGHSIAQFLNTNLCLS